MNKKGFITFNAIHHSDLICVSRHISTYLGRADNSGKTEQYHKERLDVRVIDIPYLTESILC